MRVGFAADHAGAALKAELLRRIAGTRPKDTLVDLGGDGSDPNDDYPEFAQRLGNAVRDGDVDKGILVCGSGVGASVAANKIRGVRAAVCHDTYSAHQGVEHDDMNVLTLGARVIGSEPALECSLAFLGAAFSGEARHRRRLQEVLEIERLTIETGFEEADSRP
jgi:ribose 5-phosphate isomerase B